MRVHYSIITELSDDVLGATEIRGSRACDATSEDTQDCSWPFHLKVPERELRLQVQQGSLAGSQDLQ